MSPSKFSIITVTLNAEKTIAQAIESVLAQNYQNIEHIVVDGLSTDNTLKILEKYGDKIRVISERDSGLYDAMNKGLKLATGDFVGILNADDWYEDGVFNRICKIIRANANAQIICGRTKFWQNGRPAYVFYADPSKLAYDTTLGHQSVFVKRDVYEKYGTYRTDIRYASDYDFFLRTFLAGVRYHVADFVIANMRADGLSDRHWRSVFTEVARVQTELLGTPVRAKIRLLVKIARTTVSRALSHAGLEPIVSFYRRHISILRKDRA